MVAKTFADTLFCVKTETLFNTEGDTVLAVEAFTYVDTQNEVEAKALVYTQPQTISQVQAKSVADTLNDMQIESSVDTHTGASTIDDRHWATRRAMSRPRYLLMLWLLGYSTENQRH